MQHEIKTSDEGHGRAHCRGELGHRLREVAKWVPFDWESYRPKARAGSAA